MLTKEMQDLVFEHLVDFPSRDCVFCSTKEKDSGKTHLYLVFNAHGQIYSRNALKGTWDKIKDQQEYSFIRDGFNHALEAEDVPRYSA